MTTEQSIRMLHAVIATSPLVVIALGMFLAALLWPARRKP